MGLFQSIHNMVSKGKSETVKAQQSETNSEPPITEYEPPILTMRKIQMTEDLMHRMKAENTMRELAAMGYEKPKKYTLHE